MDANGSRLAFVLYNLLESARICGVLLTPFIPSSCDKLFDYIGASSDIRTWDSAAEWGSLPESVKVEKGENLFPRIDEEKMLNELEEIEQNLRRTPVVQVMKLLSIPSLRKRLISIPSAGMI